MIQHSNRNDIRSDLHQPKRNIWSALTNPSLLLLSLIEPIIICGNKEGWESTMSCYAWFVRVRVGVGVGVGVHVWCARLGLVADTDRFLILNVPYDSVSMIMCRYENSYINENVFTYIL